jgi:hypothetical protein
MLLLIIYISVTFSIEQILHLNLCYPGNVDNCNYFVVTYIHQDENSFQGREMHLKQANNSDGSEELVFNIQSLVNEYLRINLHSFKYDQLAVDSLRTFRLTAEEQYPDQDFSYRRLDNNIKLLTHEMHPHEIIMSDWILSPIIRQLKNDVDNEYVECSPARILINPYMKTLNYRNRMKVSLQLLNNDLDILARMIGVQKVDQLPNYDISSKLLFQRDTVVINIKRNIIILKVSVSNFIYPITGLMIKFEGTDEDIIAVSEISLENTSIVFNVNKRLILASNADYDKLFKFLNRQNFDKNQVNFITPHSGGK